MKISIEKKIYSFLLLSAAACPFISLLYQLLPVPPLFVHPVYDTRAEQPKEYKKENQSISYLANYPRPSGSKKLKGRPGWRIRQGDYRVIYEIQDDQLIVIVLDVGNRNDIYK